MSRSKFLLSEVAQSQTGPFGSQLHEEDYVADGTPIVTVEHLGDTGFLRQNLPFVSDKDKTRLSKYVLREGDIVFSRVGSVDRSTYVSSTEDGWLFSGRCIRVRCNSKVSPKYISYYFRLESFKKMMRSIAVGATMPSLNTSLMDNIPLFLPSKKHQQKVAVVLSALDAKIDCNNRINAALEAMAKTLYDYWVVQFDFPDANGKPYKSSGGKMVYNPTLKREIPAGWQDSNILAVADLLGGGTPTKKKPEYWNGTIPFFTPTDADGTIFKFSTEDYITKEGLKNSSTKLFEEKTIFITARGSVGKLVLAGTKMAMNQSCYALRAKTGISHTYLFFLAKELIHHLEVKSSGSVFDSIVSSDIEFTILTIPDSSIIKKFASVAEPAFKRIANNARENQQLTQLRDWLLPMLMNGQVSVV
jgi:type I restriction enzyme S subunit